MNVAGTIQRPPAEHRRIEPDRHHRQHMVDAAERMRKTMQEAAGVADACVRQGRARRSKQDESCGDASEVHSNAPVHGQSGHRI